MVGSMHGSGVCMMAGGHAWQARQACVAGVVHGGGVHGRGGKHGRGGHAWQGHVWWGVGVGCVIGKRDSHCTATATVASHKLMFT